MIRNLSRNDQASAAENLIKGNIYNGIGLSILIDHVLVLILLTHGATDFQMGIFYAAIHITAFFSFFTPLVFVNFDMIKLYKNLGAFRSLCSIGYLGLLLVPSTNMNLKIYIFIFIHYLILSARSISNSLLSPILKYTFQKKDRERHLSILLSRLQIGIVIGKSATVILLSTAYLSENSAFFTILSIGIVANYICVLYVKKIPFIGNITGGKLTNLKNEIINSLRPSKVKHVVLLSCLQVPLLILISYTINYLKNILEYNNNTIFIISLLGTIFGLVGLKALVIIGKQVSERTLLVGIHLILFSIGLAWTYILIQGFQPSLSICVFLFISAMICQLISISLIMRLVIASLPEKNSIALSSFIQFCTALSALVTLFFLKFIDSNDGALGNYKLYFMMWSALCLLICIIGVKIQIKSQKGILEELSMLLPGNFIDMYKLYRIEKTSKTQNHRITIEGLMAKGNILSEELIDKGLRSFDIQTCHSALISINTQPDRKWFEKVLNMINIKDSPLLSEAIITLGYLNVKEAIPLIFPFLDSKDPRIQSSSVRSILSLGGELSDSLILDLYTKNPSEMGKIDILTGLATIHHKDLMYKIFSLELKNNLSDTKIMTLMQYMIELYEAKNQLMEFYDSYKSDLKMEDQLNEIFDRFQSGLDRAHLLKLIQEKEWHTFKAYLLQFNNLSSACQEFLRDNWKISSSLLATSLLFLVQRDQSQSK